MSTTLEDAGKAVHDLIESMAEVDAAQWGPAHIIFSDKNLDSDWIREACFDRSDTWLLYLQQRRKDRPEEDAQVAIHEVEGVLRVLEKLLSYPDEVLEYTEETYYR